MTSLGDTRGHSSLSATYADRIRELILEDRIADARRLLKEGLEANPRDPHLNRLQGLLELPKTTKVEKRDVDRTEEFQWLARYGREYEGRWVAVQGKELVADAASLRELRRALRNREFEIPPLIHRIG
jgi:hypothetical protein